MWYKEERHVRVRSELTENGASEGAERASERSGYCLGLFVFVALFVATVCSCPASILTLSSHYPHYYPHPQFSQGRRLVVVPASILTRILTTILNHCPHPRFSPPASVVVIVAPAVLIPLSAGRRRAPASVLTTVLTRSSQSPSRPPPLSSPLTTILTRGSHPGRLVVVAPPPLLTRVLRILTTVLLLEKALP